MFSASGNSDTYEITGYGPNSPVQILSFSSARPAVTSIYATDFPKDERTTVGLEDGIDITGQGRRLRDVCIFP